MLPWAKRREETIRRRDPTLSTRKQNKTKQKSRLKKDPETGDFYFIYICNHVGVMNLVISLILIWNVRLKGGRKKG